MNLRRKRIQIILNVFKNFTLAAYYFGVICSFNRCNSESHAIAVFSAKTCEVSRLAAGDIFIKIVYFKNDTLEAYKEFYIKNKNIKSINICEIAAQIGLKQKEIVSVSVILKAKSGAERLVTIGGYLNELGKDTSFYMFDYDQ